MKKILFILAGALALTSCHIVEKVEMKEDGSGKMTIDIDASTLMQMAGDQAEQTLQSEMGVVRDTVIRFGDMLAAKKDSIATLSKDQQELYKSLENLEIGLRMDKEKKEFAFSMGIDFQSVSELQDMMQYFKKVQQMKKADSPMAGMGNSDFSEVSYTYDGKRFSKKVSITNKEEFRKATDSLAPMMALFGSSTYTIKYTFPKKVKKVSLTEATYSDDRKTVTIPFTFSQYMTDPERIGFDITFE